MKSLLFGSILLFSHVSAGDPVPNGDEEGDVCVPYIKDPSLSLEFKSMARLFRGGDRMQVIDGLSDMNVVEALDAYGLGKQGANGDIAGQEPSVFDYENWSKFKAWESRRGMTMEQAQ